MFEMRVFEIGVGQGIAKEMSVIEQC
jgi:hypothetical protein